MPQLDLATYSSQLFWTFIVFSSLYLVLKHKALPHIAKVLKLRNKLFNFYQGIFSDLSQINNNYIISKSNDLANILEISGKEINNANNYYSIINSSPFISEYLNSYNAYYIYRKFPGIIKKKITLIKKRKKKIKKIKNK